MVFAVLVGTIFVLFNFNGLIRHAAKKWLSVESTVSRAVVAVSRVPSQTVGSSTDALSTWMRVCFTGLWVYVIAILLLALVRRRPGLAGWGMGGLIAGACSLAILSWSGVLAWLVLTGLFSVLGFIGRVLRVVIDFISPILVFALPVLLAIALIATIVSAWKSFGTRFMLLGFAGGALAYFLFRGLTAIWVGYILPALRWLGQALAYLLGWLPAVLLWLFSALFMLLKVTFIFGLLGSIGQLLIDQLKTAAVSGKSQKGLVIGSFSLGASLALILLVSAGSPALPAAHMSSPATSFAGPWRSALSTSKRTIAKKRKRRKKPARTETAAPPRAFVAPRPAPQLTIAEAIDGAWTKSTWVMESVSPTGVFMATLPYTVKEWAADSFQSVSIPIFDAAILMLALFLGMIGMLRGIFTHSEIELPVRFYNRDLLALAALPLLVGVLVLSGISENQE